MPVQSENQINHNSDEITEIITAIPSWILRRGIMLILFLLLAIILLSAFIQYPDVVKMPLKVNSVNSPKGLLAMQSGKLVKLLVNDGAVVEAKTPLAFIESTANHEDVIRLSNKLNWLNKSLNGDSAQIQAGIFDNQLILGELQPSYQVFYQEYLQYVNTQKGGLYQSQKSYLQRDLLDLKRLEEQIKEQKKVQEMEFANAQTEYEAYRKLRSKNVISESEYRQQENKYLASKYPLQQTTTSLLNNKSNVLAKQKELVALEYTIKEQQSKFLQALNSMINQTNDWLLQYVVSTPISGKISYAGILQENQNITAKQEMFVVNPGNAGFFGEVQIPQFNMGKINVGQEALIKLRSYPFEEYGMIHGKVSFITDAALKDSVFIAKIDFNKFEQKNTSRPVILKPGMMADAEIITQKSSLLQRFTRNITKMLNSGG
ncbi:HlyD family efflux transporter periplasmic adaptor subunit [Pedobacter montanisoli]|uniref:HlyD family secretion protein n=1 Tax=Pedobacter montanisoli TaxID=2923277 RepID=A0ABS9ZY24_9SPHI|nr:HlyD family efflux transporter periplasmic adaptor subunit [Pedobacter montanisoli]MCJ0743231.1 HlyD family secretion protein [Pedobacter montanisoli]